MLTAGMEITQDYVWVSIDEMKTARISSDGTFKDRDQPYELVFIFVFVRSAFKHRVKVILN